jgi:hypothetical protein
MGALLGMRAWRRFRVISEASREHVTLGFKRQREDTNYKNPSFTGLRKSLAFSLSLKAKNQVI